MRHFYSPGIVLCSIAISTSYFIFHVLAGVLATRFQYIRKKLVPSNLVYMFVIGSVAAAYISDGGPGYKILEAPLSTVNMYPEWAKKNMPQFMAPPPEIVRQLINGGVPIPWDIWISNYLIFWCLYCIISSIFFTSIVILFRKDWIDVERVPFQQAMIAYELIKRIPTSEKPKVSISLRSPFVIGTILGVAFNLPILLTYLFPWFPDIYAWRTNTCGHGSIMSLSGTPFWELVGITMVNKHPIAVSVMYLAPLSIIFNIWFWYFVYLVLMQIAYLLGYYTGLREAPTGCCRCWGPVNVRMDAPFKWDAFSTGGIIAMTFFYLLIRWRYIRDTFKAAFGAYKEFEKGEPCSYRVAWIMLLVSLALFTIQFLACGWSLAVSFLLPVSLFIFWMTKTRIWGMTGTYIRTAEHGHTLYRLLIWPRAPEPVTGEFVWAAYLSQHHADAPECGVGQIFFSAFASFRLASLMGVSNRNVLKALIVAQVIMPIVTLTTWIWMNYLFGWSKIQLGSLTNAEPLTRSGFPDNWNRLPGTDPWVHIFAIGFIVLGAISYLHARFIWFPFEPIGFLMAFSEACLFFGMWLPALIAWILKYLTLRIGGSKLYEEYGIPIAAGFAIGFISISFIGGIIGACRFFITF